MGYAIAAAGCCFTAVCNTHSSREDRGKTEGDKGQDREEVQ